MIRVLIVDDSPTARGLLRAILSADAEIAVVGEAQDGVEAIALTRALHPSIITMDLRMPNLDGFEATREIMSTLPTPIVVVTGSFTGRDVENCLAALRTGALAVLAKPAGPAQPGFEEAAQELLQTVKAMAQVKVVRHWRQSSPAKKMPKRAVGPAAPPRGKIVAIAASTGGPAALHRLVLDLSGDFPVPILVVQHISHGFVGGLAEWLNKAGNLHVKRAEAGEALVPRTMYLAPDNYHLGVAAPAAVALSAEPPVLGFRPSGTFLFESVAEVFGAATVAVILTGMGDDGVQGLHAVRRAGGQILAQDEKSSVIFGMPGAAVAAGLADQVLPLEAVAGQLTRWTRTP